MVQEILSTDVKGEKVALNLNDLIHFEMKIGQL